MDERQRIREGRLMPPPSRRLNDKSVNQILTASKSSLVTAGEISNMIMLYLTERNWYLV